MGKLLDPTKPLFKEIKVSDMRVMPAKLRILQLNILTMRAK